MPVSLDRHKRQLNWAPLIAMQCGVPAGCVGNPGTAKSSTFEALAKASGRRYSAYLLSNTMAEDVGGYPMIQDVVIAEEQHKAMVHVLSDRLLRATLEPSMLVFDELTDCGRSTMAAAQETLRLTAKHNWVAACWNPPDIATNGSELSAPAVNRMCVCQWETPIDDFFQGMLEDDGGARDIAFPAPDVPLLPPNWPQFRPPWAKLVVEFLQRNPALQNACPVDPDKRGEPWPSIRTWEYVAQCLGGVDAVGASKMVRNLVIEGCVGRGAALAFAQFITSLDLPDPEEALRNPAGFDLPNRGDLICLFAHSVAAAIKSFSTPTRFEAGLDVFERLYAWNRSGNPMRPIAPTAAYLYYGLLWKAAPEGHCSPVRSGPLAELEALRSKMA